tara:strand:- start:2611 stop:2829 length:219 start_codon:yes stop_codon:yes gene_type:complete
LRRLDPIVFLTTYEFALQLGDAASAFRDALVNAMAEFLNDYTGPVSWGTLAKVTQDHLRYLTYNFSLLLFCA